jgi:hypothetical protein
MTATVDAISPQKAVLHAQIDSVNQLTISVVEPHYLLYIIEVSIHVIRSRTSWLLTHRIKFCL